MHCTMEVAKRAAERQSKARKPKSITFQLLGTPKVFVCHISSNAETAAQVS